MQPVTAEEIIRIYGLMRHPEGGHFKETYRSEASALHAAPPQALAGSRNFSTAIYFLLAAGEKSALHRIKSDEVWHFYLGGPLVIAQLLPGKPPKKTILGQNILAGQVVQYTVPGGSWFGAYPCPGTEFSLVGCTVSPGFDYSDFELAERSELLKEFPEAEGLICELAPARRGGPPEI